MISAFGIEHGEIYKSDTSKDKASTGRKFLTSWAPGVHGAVAGKRGKKVRTTANEVLATSGGSLAGSTAGALAGMATRKPALVTGGSGVGYLAGHVGGSQWAGRRNQRKGYLKRESSE